MYDGWRSKHDVDLEWVNKTNEKLDKKRARQITMTREQYIEVVQ